MFNRRIIIIAAVGVIVCLLIGLVVLGVIYLTNSGYSIKGSGVTKIEDRQISEYKNLVVNGQFNVTVSQAEKETLTISAEDNILPKIITEVKGDTLTIDFERKFPYLSAINVQNSKPIEIKLTYNTINNISLDGQGSIKSTPDTKIRTDNLTVLLAGSGNINLNVFTNNITSTLTGAGVITLDGSTIKQKINLTGSGQYLASNLESRESDAVLTGSGIIKIRGDDKLTINVNGSGGVEYAGSPKKIDQNIVGTGTVKKIN